MDFKEVLENYTNSKNELYKTLELPKGATLYAKTDMWWMVYGDPEFISYGINKDRAEVSFDIVYLFKDMKDYVIYYIQDDYDIFYTVFDKSKEVKNKEFIIDFE